MTNQMQETYETLAKVGQIAVVAMIIAAWSIYKLKLNVDHTQPYQAEEARLLLQCCLMTFIGGSIYYIVSIVFLKTNMLAHQIRPLREWAKKVFKDCYHGKIEAYIASLIQFIAFTFLLASFLQSASYFGGMFLIRIKVLSLV